MIDADFEDDLEKLFGHGQQLWLLGAGASFGSKLPLMNGLTERVIGSLETKKLPVEGSYTVADLLRAVRNEIGGSVTIEGILDHLSDFGSMARRSDNPISIPVVNTSGGSIGASLRFDTIMSVRADILGEIRQTIRWGYVHSENSDECISGSAGRSIVEIAPHLKFVDAIFSGVLAARERRLRPVEFFTTNYDTLIEDALALRGISYVDGFRGGAVGFWDPTVYPESVDNPTSVRASVTKIHGSIDWASTSEQRIVRRRIGDLYPSDGEGGEVLIYPQATKYEFVRREPFDSLFQRFRTVLSRRSAQVMFICGYGFGDEHVNRELEEALALFGGQLTVVVMSKERSGLLVQWASRSFGERLYVLCEDGAWCGTEGPYLGAEPRDWWTFEGMTNLVRRGGRLA
jgi:SIR2-like protein